jgi:hypothetical protein
MIAADTDGENLLLYSNRSGNGYARNEDAKGGYRKVVPFVDITEEQMKKLREKNCKFYPMREIYGSDLPGIVYTTIEYWEPDAVESEVFATSTPYAFSRSDKLAKKLGFPVRYGFSSEFIITHECAHGIVSSVDNQLADLLAYQDLLCPFIDIFGETVAVYSGLTYAEKYLSVEAESYLDRISSFVNFNQDAFESDRREAYRLVLEERSRVEAMADLVKQLHGLRTKSKNSIKR